MRRPQMPATHHVWLVRALATAVRASAKKGLMAQHVAILHVVTIMRAQGTARATRCRHAASALPAGQEKCAILPRRRAPTRPAEGMVNVMTHRVSASATKASLESHATNFPAKMVVVPTKAAARA